MAKGKTLIDTERCKGCGLCIKACPKNILVMSKETNTQSVNYPVCIDENNCIGCCFCATMCPDCCIEIEVE